MKHDPAQPYGPLLATRLRLVTWDVWARFGPWRQRQTALEGVLAGLNADLVALQESWADSDGKSQAAVLGELLGLSHAVCGGASPCAVLSRWPIVRHREKALEGGTSRPSLLILALELGRGGGA